MTAGQRRDIDLDLLADYAGGALDGTPEHARVTRLVETDPRWAAALADLRTAEALVHADLTAFARTPESIPGEIAARLTETVADAHPAPVASLDRRRRRYRVAAAAAVAAGLVGVAGYAGYAVLVPEGPARAPSILSGPADESAAETVPSAPAGAETADSPRERLRGYPVPVSASGADYSRDDLGTVRERGEVSAADAPVRPPSGLERLAAPAALGDCLTGVRRAHPGTVTKVDFARFEGKPALIIAIRPAGGADRFVVAGPDCRGADPDVRYSTRA